MRAAEVLCSSLREDSRVEDVSSGRPGTNLDPGVGKRAQRELRDRGRSRRRRLGRRCLWRGCRLRLSRCRRRCRGSRLGRCRDRHTRGHGRLSRLEAVSRGLEDDQRHDRCDRQSANCEDDPLAPCLGHCLRVTPVPEVFGCSARRDPKTSWASTRTIRIRIEGEFSRGSGPARSRSYPSACAGPELLVMRTR
jgi:hypothetical protein